VLNQKGSPAWFSDTFANIPTFGYKGRMFISIDTFAFYRDTGTGWDLIGGPGIGTLTGSGATGQVSFFNGTQVLTGNNNLFWDNTNSRLGINTTTPGQPLDIHSTGNTLVQLNNTSTGNSNISFQNQDVAKWRVGNVYNAGANSFDIYNVGLATTILSISSTTNTMTLATNLTTTGAQFVQNGFYLSNANAGAQAFYTNMWGRDNGINFALRNLTGGAGFIFQSAASYDYTFPASAGTIALTSNLSAYLPLAGGTLTGALIGTSATFTGDLTIDTNTLFVDSTNNRIGIGTTSPTNKLTISNDGNAAIALRINDTNANASFISMSASNTDAAIIANGTAAIPIDIYTGGSARVRVSSGGNLLIGTTTDNGNKLQVTGKISLTQSLVPSLAVNSGYYTIDSAAETFSLGSLGSVNIGAFSGMVLVTNTANGVTMLFLCGGGTGVLVSQSTGGATGTMTNFAGSGYTFTTAYTLTANYSFQLFRTRVIA